MRSNCSTILVFTLLVLQAGVTPSSAQAMDEKPSLLGGQSSTGGGGGQCSTSDQVPPPVQTDSSGGRFPGGVYQIKPENDGNIHFVIQGAAAKELLQYICRGANAPADARQCRFGHIWAFDPLFHAVGKFKDDWMLVGNALRLSTEISQDLGTVMDRAGVPIVKQGLHEELRGDYVSCYRSTNPESGQVSYGLCIVKL